MKLRHFYKLDNKKQPIPGSNIKRKSSPGKLWKEIIPLCCEPNDIACTCGFRYFVQVDYAGKPVPGTLIKRTVWPKMEGLRWQEIDWKSVCCANITWSLGLTDTTGSLVITVNGNEVVNATTASSGTIKPNFGDTIEITLDNTGTTPVNALVVTGGFTDSDTAAPTTISSFVWNGEQTDIAALISGTIEP